MISASIYTQKERFHIQSHFNVEFVVRNLQKIVHIPKTGLLKSIQSNALKMAVFANGGVLSRLKIRHFQGFTVSHDHSTRFTIWQLKH